MLLKRLLSLAVPASVAVAAYLHARAVGSLVDGVVTPSTLIAPFALERAAASTSTPDKARSADAILDRNPFDHDKHSLRMVKGEGPASAPLCDDVRVVAAVRGPDGGGSFAALRIEEGPDAWRSHLRKQGDTVGNLRVAWVGVDRVWLERDGELCQTRVFAAGTDPRIASLDRARFRNAQGRPAR